MPPDLAAATLGALSDSRLSAGPTSASVWVEGLGVILEYAPAERLLPASNQKLVTAAGAMALLGPEHRFVTRLVGSGQVNGGTLEGDLLLVAGGDPSLTRQGPHSLAALAAQVRDRGLSVVTGDLVVDAHHHEPATEAPGWQDFHIPTYTGPLSALTVDDNRFRSDAAYLADPAAGNGEAFRDALAAVGVTVTGSVVTGAAPAGVELGSLASAGRDELVARMLRDSDNEVAEALVREIGLKVSGEGTTTSGSAAIDAWLASVCLTDLGANADGSGLSRANGHSGRDLRRLLHVVDAQPWGPTFRTSLAVAGRSGTLGGRLTGPATAGAVVAKTGTILDGAALSGYATTVGGRAVVFSVIGNGSNPAAITSAIDDLVTSVVAWPA